EWVNGFFYAFDRRRKEIAWFEPVANQAVLIERFGELPMILFTARQQVPVNKNAVTPQTTVSSRNKRTGKLIYRNSNSQLYAPQYEQPFHTLVIDRRSGTIDLLASRMTLRHYVDTSGTEAQPRARSKGEPSG